MTAKHPSVEIFARTVTGCEGLGYCLLEVARTERAAQGCDEGVEERASELMLEALSQVGISPQTEAARREKLFRLLRGERLSEPEVQRNVDYILSQMVIQSKAALAECLAIKPCVEHLRALVRADRLPPPVEFKRGVWERRFAGLTEEGAPRLAEWREGADGLFCLPVTTETMSVCGVQDSDYGLPGANGLLVFGVAEVKCFRRAKRDALRGQMDAHVARLAGGLQIRDRHGKMESAIPPQDIWYASWDGQRVSCLPAESCPFRLTWAPPCNRRKLSIEWTHTLMHSLIRFSVGPAPRFKQGYEWFSGSDNFDAALPYGEQDLEDIGCEMAAYALGAMADQSVVDLDGMRWGRNMERALCQPAGHRLSRCQLTRRQKLLARLLG